VNIFFHNDFVSYFTSAFIILNMPAMSNKNPPILKLGFRKEEKQKAPHYARLFCLAMNYKIHSKPPI